MLKRILRGACACFAAILIVLALAATLSHAIWHRSLQATVYERVLAHRNATDRTAEEEIARLEALREAGESAYALPKSLNFDVSVESAAYDSPMTDESMACFILNGDARPCRTVFYLHGGAYIHQFNRYQWRFMNRLARKAGVAVVAPVYRLAPFGNCLGAYRALTGLYAGYVKAHPDAPVILMGDSAGGGLALGLAEALKAQGLPRPERLILFSPWVDVTMENPDIADYVDVEPILHLDLVKVHGRFWADDIDPHDWHVSPLFGDLADLPPVTLYAGTRELLYPDIRLLAEALEEAGVQVDFHIGTGLNHDYPLMPLPEGRRAADQAIALCKG